jgi:hypothetical protein
VRPVTLQDNLDLIHYNMVTAAKPARTAVMVSRITPRLVMTEMVTTTTPARITANGTLIYQYLLQHP